VIGKVGSGKSSLIASILGEIPKVSGRIAKNGKIAYVPQQVIHTTYLRNQFN
jgi:ABC-type Mn2+/Zn2+ transport system ATPase subunit